MSVEIRSIGEKSDLVEAVKTFRTAMIGLPRLASISDAMLERLYEGGRTLAAFDDGLMVGTTNSYSGEIVVPGGGRLPHAAVTHVGVLATKARTGIARALMTRQLRQARDSGDVLATLRATEASIYGNFGYAVASVSADYEIDRRRAVLRKELRGLRPVRYAAVENSWDLQARIYSSQPDPRPGSISRSDRWWNGPEGRLGSEGRMHYLVTCGAEGNETGYVRYRPLSDQAWVESTNRTVLVNDLVAHTDADYAALVEHLLSIDIVHRILMPVRPMDDPLPWMIAACRSARITGTLDETWLRLVDTETALSRRAYQGAGEVGVDIRDYLLPDYTFRFDIRSLLIVRTY